MNENTISLFNTVKYRNVVDLFLCSILHRICNGKQFVIMKGTDFANFLNLQDTSEPVKVQKDENRRVCYLINVISKNLLDQSVSDEWVKTILERCNISYRYYRSHYSEPGGADATKADKAFAESIRNAVDFFTKYG